LSPDSARKSRGSKASPTAEKSDKGGDGNDSLPKTLPPSSAAVGPCANAPTHIHFLEPTQVMDIDGIESDFLPASGAAVPAMLLQTQAMQATEVNAQVIQQEESQKEQRGIEPVQYGRTGVIPETDEAMYDRDKEINYMRKSAPAEKKAAEGGSTPVDFELQIAEIENQLREQWLASEEPFGT
jgi:hypothetical protein